MASLMPKQVPKAWAFFLKHYLVTLIDLFSFATMSKEMQLSDKQVSSIHRDIESKKIVLSYLSDGIHWNFSVKSIKLIDSNNGVPVAKTSPKGMGKVE